MQEEFLHKKLNERKEQGAFRRLRIENNKIDFCSNDYLGIARNQLISRAMQLNPDERYKHLNHGSTGSRLLSGNDQMIGELEHQIARFHEAPAALIFNSGYDANIGLMSCVAQRGDTIIYDQLCHASIRDGIRLSFAEAHSFTHNDVADLAIRLHKATGNIFVVTESVFSMDGDLAPLREISALCERYKAALIVDEAHATGVIGMHGEGLVQQLGFQKKCFARVHTFGKAVGCHGAIVLGSETLKHYLINFSRPFIFSTALPAVSIAAIETAYNIFPGLDNERMQLGRLCLQFQEFALDFNNLDKSVRILKSETPVQGIIVPGNDAIKKLARNLNDVGLDVRPILYPTVPRGAERLRIVLHAYNTYAELDLLIHSLKG